MPANNIEEHYEALKDIFYVFKAGQLRQGWNKFKENYARKMYGANWEQHQMSKTEVCFMVFGIVLGLLILLSVFFIILLFDSLEHAFSKDGPFHEVVALKSILTNGRRR